MPLNDQQIKKLTDAGYSKEMIAAYSNFKESGGQSNLGEQAFMADTGLSPTYQRQTDAITDFATSIYNGFLPTLIKGVAAIPNLVVNAPSLGTLVTDTQIPEKIQEGLEDFSPELAGFAGNIFAGTRNLLEKQKSATEMFQNWAFEQIDNNLKGYVDPKYNQQLIKLNEKDEIEIADARSFANGLGQGLGSMLSFIVPGAGLAKAGLAAKTATMVSGTLVTAPTILEAGKEAGLSNADNVRMTLALAPIIGAIELIGGMEASVLSKMVGKKVATNVAEEAVEQMGKSELKSALSGLAGKGISSADDFSLAMKGGLQWGIKNILSKKNIGNAIGEGAEEYLQGTVQKAGEQLYDNFFAKGKEKGEGAYGTQLLLPEGQEGKGVLGTRYSKEAFYEDFSAAIYGGIIGGGMSQLTNPVVNQSLYGYIDLAVRKGKGQEAIAALQNIVNAEVQAGRIQDPNAAMESIGRMFNVAEQLKGADNKKMNASLRYELYDSQYNIRPQFEAIVQNYEAQLTALEETLQNDPTNTISIIEQKKAIAEGFDDYNRATEGIAAANANIQSIATQYKPINLRGELLTIKDKKFNIQDNPRVNSLIYGMGTPLPQSPPSPAGGGTTAVQPKPANLSSLIGANVSVGSVSGTIAFSPESGYSLIEDNGNETPLGLDDIDITTIGGTYDPDSVTEVITEDLGFAEEVKDEKPTPTETTDEESGLVEITPDPGLESEQPQPEVIPATSPTIEVKEVESQENVTTEKPAISPYGVIAADYLFTGGPGVMLSTDYFIQALSGAFTNAGGLIEKIRQKYIAQIGDLGNLKDAIGTENYNKMIAEIRSAISDTYNNQEVNDIFNIVLNNATGFPSRLGNEVSSNLERLNEQLSASQPTATISETEKPTEKSSQLLSEFNQALNNLLPATAEDLATKYTFDELNDLLDEQIAQLGENDPYVQIIKDAINLRNNVTESAVEATDEIVTQAEESGDESQITNINIIGTSLAVSRTDGGTQDGGVDQVAGAIDEAGGVEETNVQPGQTTLFQTAETVTIPQGTAAAEGQRETLKPTTDETAKQENVQPVSEGVQGVRTQEQKRKEGTELRAGEEKEVTTTKTETNAKEQQGGPVRGQGEQVAAEGRGDRNLPESDQAKLPERQAAKEVSQEEVDNFFQEDKTVEQKYKEGKKLYITDEDGNPVEDEFILANGKPITIRFVVGEANSVTPSHNPITFSKSKGFPTNPDGKTVNDNDYENNKDFQTTVFDITNKLDARAKQEVPFVKDGVVYSGNNRTMSIQAAYLQGLSGRYRRAVEALEKSMRFPKGAIAKMENPMFFYEIVSDFPATTENFNMFNKDDRKKKSGTEEAIALGKILKERVAIVSYISSIVSQYNSLAEFYADSAAVRGVFKTLQSEGLVNTIQLTGYIPKGLISTSGKEFLESIMIGTAVSEDNLRTLSEEGNATVRNRVANAIQQLNKNAALMQVSPDGRVIDYSIIDQVNKAITIQAEINRMRSAGETYETSLMKYIKTLTLFEKKEMSPEALLLNILMNRSDSALKQGLAEYNQRAAGSIANQLDIFGGGQVKDKRTIIEEVLSLYDKNMTNAERMVMGMLKNVSSGGYDAQIADTKDQQNAAKRELDDLLNDEENPCI